MKIRIDADKFDECQIEMATAIVAIITTELRKTKLPDDQLKDLVAGIAFDVCCILDGCQTFGKEADDIYPVLTFQAKGCADDEVISNGGNSYMHETVHRIVEELFQPKRRIGVDG